MKYFHRTAVGLDQVVAQAAAFFGSRMSPTEEGPRRRKYASAIGHLTVSVQAEGGHYTLVTVETNQPGESELDKLAKRFLAAVHALADERHALRGAY
jgi:hypothetical protein